MLGAAFLFFACALEAAAGMIGVSPLRVDFDVAQQTGVLRVFNTGATDISMQVDARDWSQAEDGSDEYESTSDVIAVPPIFSIAPGETQIIRVGLVGGQRPDREVAHRLFLTELPQPKFDPLGGQLRMRLIVSLPIFTAPAAVPAESDLEVIETSTEDGRLRARFRNPGNTHIRIQEVTAIDSSGAEAQRHASAVYLLPGATRDFYFDTGAGETTISRLVAVTDAAGIVEYEVVTP
ncbi:MAG: molecular chaperone [Gammaproteobacteria bacterium]|nr:molecular chaperone [Gammaproteobacteria bacterium]NND36921.1 molecular chaperone [Gammaproteobacteria bacterium]